MAALQPLSDLHNGDMNMHMNNSECKSFSFTLNKYATNKHNMKTTADEAVMTVETK